MHAIHHPGRLRARQLGLRRVGTRRLYRARPERLAEARAFLESFWDQNLAVIKQSGNRWCRP